MYQRMSRECGVEIRECGLQRENVDYKMNRECNQFKIHL